jgi:hypothetical protein
MYDPLLLLEIHLPSVFKLLSPHIRDLDQLRDMYRAREQLVLAATRERGGHTAEGTIFDLWWNAREGNQDSIALLDFIDRTVESLVARTSETFHSPIRTICKQMLFKNDDLHSEYTRHLAELAIIELFLRSGKFQLKQVEYKLPNGKSVDFLVSHQTEEGVTNDYLFEVYMVDFFNIAEKIKSSDDLHRFIEKRILDKFAGKIDGVDMGKVPPLALVPVLRGELDELVPYEDGVSWLRSTNRIADPYVFGSRQEKSGLRYHFLLAKQWFGQVRKQQLVREVEDSIADGRSLVEKGRDMTKRGQELMDWGQLTKAAIPFVSDVPTLNFLVGAWGSIHRTAGEILNEMLNVSMPAAGGSASFAATSSLGLITILTSEKIEHGQRCDAAALAERFRDLASLPRVRDDVAVLMKRLRLDVGGSAVRSPLENFTTAYEAFSVTADDSDPAISSLLPLRSCINDLIGILLLQRQQQEPSGNAQTKVRSILEQMGIDGIDTKQFDLISEQCKSILDRSLSPAKGKRFSRTEWQDALLTGTLWLKAFLESIDEKKMRS